MTAVTVTEFNRPPHMAPKLAQQVADDVEKWVRVCLIASMIPADMNLDDDGDVIRALYQKGFCWADLANALDDAIVEAREMRAGR